MELNYYVIKFDNNLEYIIESDIPDIKTMLTTLSTGNFKGDYFGLSRTNKENPLYIKKDRLFSVQKVDEEGFIGAQTKKWRLVI